MEKTSNIQRRTSNVELQTPLTTGRILPGLVRRFSIIALLCALVCSARAESFFPDTQGTTWEYSQRGAEPSRLTVRIIGKELSKGKELLKLETTAGDQTIRTDILTADDRGVLCHERRDSDGRAAVFNSPRVLLPTPLQIGTTWELDDEIAGSTMHHQFKVTAEEEVIVPAGTFRAYRLHSQQPWPMSVSVDRWFAPGTGFIKEVTASHGPTGRLLSRVETVLTSLSLATPAPNQSPSASSPVASSTQAPSVSIEPGSPPKITLEVAAERDGDPITDFRSDTPNIYIYWGGEHLPLYSLVRVAWIAEDVGDIAEPNFVVDETETEVTDAEFGARFTLSRPPDGWAAGRYRVELYLDENLLKTVPVNITD